MLFAYTYQDPRMLSATQIPAFSASNVSVSYAFGAYRIFGREFLGKHNRSLWEILLIIKILK